MYAKRPSFVVLTKYVLIEKTLSNAINDILPSVKKNLGQTFIKERLVIYLDKYSKQFYIKCQQKFDSERLNFALYIVEPEVDYLLDINKLRVLILHKNTKHNYNSHYLAKAIIKNQFKSSVTPTLNKDSDLTTRERAVVNCVCSGLRDKEIAGKLGISLNTVKSHTQNIFLKYRVKNRVELVLKGL